MRKQDNFTSLKNTVADPGGLTVFVDTAKMRGEVWQDNRAVGCRGDAVRRLLCYNIRK
jgi:hypothetical protein